MARDAMVRSASVTAVLRRPSLWRIAVVELRRMAPRGWWRRRPFLPVPDRDYMRFRLETQYGDADHVPTPEDLVTWLRWCRDFPHQRSASPG